LKPALPAEAPPKAVKPEDKPAAKEEHETPEKSELQREIEDEAAKTEKKEDDEFIGREHLRKLRDEAQSELKSSKSGTSDSRSEDAIENVPPVEELEKMNVHQLRKLARSIPSFPIKGRDISIANRGILLDYLKKL
jgi:hypothetical protein